MLRNKIIDLIFSIAKQKNAFDILEETFSNLSKEVLSNALIECEIIPEHFEHDSSEEKLWAKYCDILLAHSLNHLGISSEVLRTRGDSADVYGKTKNYTIVGDAKAFRLSRTAKNQKDFKIKSLDDWRKENTYACLISPLSQYPIRSSQIYSQAIKHNVTLLSYTHLKFLVDFFLDHDLTSLWITQENTLSIENKNAISYWEKIDEKICHILDKDLKELNNYKIDSINITKKLGQEGINFWETKKNLYQELSREQAISELIKAEKIEAKINTIKKAIGLKI